MDDSQLCPGCSSAIVSLQSRCSQCKTRVPDSCYNVSAPRARHLPELKLNHVIQVSLGATEAVLNSGLPVSRSVSGLGCPSARSSRDAKPVYEVEKIVDKRRKNMKLQYLVVWKGYPGEDTWEDFITLVDGCKESIDVFEGSHIPPVCTKRVNEVRSCGDTGCDGPPEAISSTSSGPSKAGS